MNNKMNREVLPPGLITPHFEIPICDAMALVPYIRKRHLKKGELLLEQGRIDRNFYTVQHGLLRNFIIRDGEEWTRWFAVPGDVVCSMAGVARGCLLSSASMRWRIRM